MQQIAFLNDYNGTSGNVVNSAATTTTLTLSPTAGSSANFSGVIGGDTAANAISLAVSGAGTQILAGNNTYTGATTISAGTLAVASGGAIGSGGGSAVTVNGAAAALNVTGNNGLTGSSSLTVANGTAILAAANNFTGPTNVTGVLQLANSGAISSSALTINSGSTIQLRGDVNTTFVSNGTISTAGTGTTTYNFDVNDITSGVTGKTLTLGNMSQFGAGNTTDVLNLTGGNGYTLLMCSGTAGTGAVQMYNNTTLNSNTPGVTLQMPGITINWNGSYTLGFAGAGNFNLGAISAYSGRTLTPTFNQTGTLTLTGANSFGGVTAAITNSGTLALNNNGALGGVNTLTISGSPTLDNSSAGPVTISANPAQTWNSSFSFFGSGNSLNLGTGAVTLGGNTTVTVNANTLTVGGPIGGGAFNLTKAGPGNLTLAGNNTYSGSTTITAGTLSIGNGGAGASIGSTSAIVDNGTLVFNHSDNVLFSLGISGSGGLVKSGGGTLTLATANTYTGPTTINAGTVILHQSIAVPVTNYSFESPVESTGYHESTTPTGWTGSGLGITAGNNTTYNPTGTEPDGTQAAFTKGTGSSLNQTINFASGGVYTISFYAVARSGTTRPRLRSRWAEPFWIRLPRASRLGLSTLRRSMRPPARTASVLPTSTPATILSTSTMW